MTKTFTLSVVGGRPTLFFLAYVHFRLTSCRCQPKTVSGWKMRIRLRNCFTGRLLCCFKLADSTAKVSFSARLGLIGLSSYRCRMFNCWRNIRISKSLSLSEVGPRRSSVKSVENICARMNQAMKIGTPNEMKSDFSTAWHGGRSGVYPLE